MAKNVKRIGGRRQWRRRGDKVDWGGKCGICGIAGVLSGILVEWVEFLGAPAVPGLSVNEISGVETLKLQGFLRGRVEIVEMAWGFGLKH
jgi:hypothetical protein